MRLQRDNQMALTLKTSPNKVMALAVSALVILAIAAQFLSAQADELNLRKTVAPVEVAQDNPQTAAAPTSPSSSPVAIAVTNFELSTLPLDAFADTE